jgi:hypothetical protein
MAARGDSPPSPEPAMSRILALSAVAFLALPALALESPNACDLVKPDEINLVASSKVARVLPQKSGNPSECGFMDAKKTAILVVTVRTVQYAVKDEMFQERDNLEKIYHAHSKPVEAIGDDGYWLGANHQLGFRRGKTIVTVRFATTRNQNEADTSQIARVIDARLPK